MYQRDDPASSDKMSADERLEEVATIFARSILRLLGRVLPHLSTQQNLPESSRTCFELSAPLSPDRPAG